MLYYKRGSQHRYAGHFEHAIMDFKKALQLDKEYSLPYLGLGFIFSDKDWNKTAEVYIRNFLEHNPGNTAGITALARSLKGQKRGADAVIVYKRVLEKVKQPGAEFYLEYADSYLLSGDFNNAIKILDKGISNTGHITSLHKKALDIEIDNNFNDKALKRLDILIEHSPQKERWLFEKGKLLESRGKYKDAKKSYLKAKEYYNSRPQNRQRVPALIEIIKKVEKSLDRIR